MKRSTRWSARGRRAFGRFSHKEKRHVRIYQRRSFSPFVFTKWNWSYETDCNIGLRIGARRGEHGRSAAAALVELSDLHAAGRDGTDVQRAGGLQSPRNGHRERNGQRASDGQG